MTNSGEPAAEGAPSGGALLVCFRRWPRPPLMPSPGRQADPGARDRAKPGWQAGSRPRHANGYMPAGSVTRGLVPCACAGRSDRSALLFATEGFAPWLAFDSARSACLASFVSHVAVITQKPAPPVEAPVGSTSPPDRAGNATFTVRRPHARVLQPQELRRFFFVSSGFRTGGVAARRSSSAWHR